METKGLPLGVHLIIEFWKSKINIRKPRQLKKILIEAALAAKSTPIGVKIHTFNPHGISGICLLAESHISIHTWPEKEYIAFDIFTCGQKTEPFKALDYLKKVFEPQKASVKEIKRGVAR